MVCVDIDAFVWANQQDWDRLGELTRRRRLTGPEADELVRLYQRTATHLSIIRSTAPEPALISDLSMRVSRARGRITSSGGMTWEAILRFIFADLPAALYRSRYWALAVTTAFLAVAVLAGWWVATEPGAQEAFGPPEMIDSYVDESFAAYYSNLPAPEFAAQVWTNNAWIAAQCVAFGISGIWPVMVLIFNAVGVGVAGGIMVSHDAGGVFFGLILPHGLLELMAVFVAAGAGLQLFWAWIVPGDRTRSRALAEEGRALVIIAIGLVVVLGVSGIIEAFVTPSQMPTALKIGIGALALAGYWFYVVFFGRRAVAAGSTGDLSEYEAGSRVLLRG